MNLNDKIQAVNNSFLEDKKKFKLDLIKFNDLKNKYLGRKGLLSELYSLLNNITDLSTKDSLVFLIFLLLIVILGIYPNMLMSIYELSTNKLIIN